MNINQTINFGVFGFILVIILLACDLAEPIQKQFNKIGKPLQITIYAHKTQSELNAALKEHLGKDGLKRIEYPNVKREGWSYWTDENTCEIHVIELNNMAQKDRFVSWGHELAHCTYGKYHKENNL